MMSFALICMLFEILVFCPETDGGSLTWNEPPPTQIVQAVGNPVHHYSSRQLHEGTINANLSWQFDLTELKFKTLILLFNGTILGGVTSSGQGLVAGFKNQFGFDWILNQTFVRLIIFNVTIKENGTFTCRVRVRVDTGQGFGAHFDSNVQVNVVAPPCNIISSSDLNVTAPAELTLNCSADGKPKPTIIWTRVSDNTFVNMPLKFTGEKDKGSYRCTAANGVGKPLIKDVFVDVHVPPMVTLASEVYVGREQTASLICEVEGNPTPIIYWNPCYGRSVICDEQYFNISIVQTARTNYTCTATNALGVDSATTLLLIGGKNVYLRLNLTGECDSKDSVWATLQKELGKIFSKTRGYSGAELIDVRCESLIFDVVLKFGIRVAEDDTISIIQSAIVDGKLGELSENVSYIIGIPPVEESTTVAPTGTTAKSDGTASAPSSTGPMSAYTGGTASASSTTEPTSAETGGSAGPRWAIIGAVAGGIVVLAILVVVLPWWVHKQRKCRKNFEICNSDLELRHGNEGGYLQVQCAQSGPPVANGSDGAAEQEKEVAGVIPTYAVMDMSKKSKKQADKKPPEYAVVDKSKKKEKQEAAANGTVGAAEQETEVTGVIPTYAVVDKSKKSKKQADEKPPEYAVVDKSKIKEKQEASTIPTYATTDESEKFQEVPPGYAEKDKFIKKKKKIDDKNLYETLDEPKKEKKPGELLHADVGHFQNPGMPTVSISLEPLPAIKRADPYERTDYADITQFLKGNATLSPNDGNRDGNETESSKQKEDSRKRHRNAGLG